MCGIAGVATRDGLRQTDEHLVECMLRSLAHRGPDDQYARADGTAMLGTRRLSIIDLETGRQPLSNEDDSVWVSQNGEIYNYVELRADLEAKGHTFRTKGDTEAIAHLYEERGERFVDELRGMFAIAIWDRARRRLILARDRLGKKPLYWTLRDGRLAYGSELKALLTDPEVTRTIDRASLALYLQYQYVPAPGTIFEGIQKLPPASVLTWDGGEPKVSRYWTPTYAPKLNLSHDEERVRAIELLRESVRLRLRSDVPIGIFLSGGMDSSVIVALAAAESAQPLRTFTIGSEDPAYDETGYARAVAEHFGTRHVDEVMSLDAVALLPELADHYDEPFGDYSAMPTFRVAQLAARDVKVVLTGDGGDETFGGYDRYRFHAAADVLSGVPAGARRGMTRLAFGALGLLRRGTGGPRRQSDWPRIAGLTLDERYTRLMSIFHGEQLARVMAGDPVAASTDAYLLAVLRDGPRNALDRMLRADTLTYLPDDLLVKMDRATMANSLEARAPMLDHVLIDFVSALPHQRKLRGLKMKVLLREIAHDLLPPRLVNRGKLGFSLPIGDWFARDLGKLYEELVLAPDAQLRDHLDQGVAATLLAQHRAGHEQNAHRLWLLLMFEAWARRWVAPGGGRTA